jgi:hypothetical protein
MHPKAMSDHHVDQLMTAYQLDGLIALLALSDFLRPGSVGSRCDEKQASDLRTQRSRR